tara:strand:- start:49887 stop:53663 length:3777 start_codon:yes stop_codon:yes gene_type:complete
MKFNKTLIALALASTLSACGSDNSNSTVTPDTVTPPVTAAPVETTVAGQAVKGVLANAKVTVYKFDEAGEPVALDPETELKDGEIITDGLGNYSFVVLDYEGPIKIELSPSTDPANPTTMICDAPAGCGDTAFGVPIDLTAVDPGFKLAAISVVGSDSAGEVEINVSALTHLAAELIEAHDGAVTVESVAEQSIKIASAFGIEGDITQLKATVTTDASAVAGEDNEAELRLGLINAGIMAALFSGETDDENVLSTKLAEVAANLIEHNGALLVHQDETTVAFELAISDVLEGAAAAASKASDEISADETLTSIIDVTQEKTNLANEQAYQEGNVGANGLSEVVVEKLTEGDAVAKAKAMVEDVRLFTHLFDSTSTEGAGISGQGNQYLALMDDAGVMIQTEADSFTLLAQVSDVLADLSMQHDNGTLTPEASTIGVDISTLIDGATGRITFVENTSTGGISFNINATAAGSEIISLNASAEFSNDSKSIVLSLNGSVESGGAKFTLKDSSFVQINLDSVVSRTSLEDDTFEGEIISGELALDLILEQKATNTMTNPITFIGMLHTKLLPVDEHVIDERWDWDDNNQQGIITYGRPEIDTLILPEMLSLSGAFSSLDGDLISATLTVNINNLEGYDAPEFKYIGKEVASILNITHTDNVIVLTEADSVSDTQQYTITHSFTAGEQEGNWTGSRSAVSKNPELYWGGTGYEQQHFSRRSNANSLDEIISYTAAHVIDRDENNFYAKSIRITPVDQNDDSIIDGYQFEKIEAYPDNGIEYDFDGDGNIELTALVNADGQILTANGATQVWAESINLGIYPSIDDFIQDKPWELIAHPLTLNSTSKYFVSTLGESYPLLVDDVGTVTTFFSEGELASIAAGEFTELNPAAYLTQPLVKDALTIVVSDDANTVTATVEGAFIATQTFSGGNGSDLTYSSQYIEGHDSNTTLIWSQVNSDNGLDISEVTVSTMVQESWGTFAMRLKFVPVDEQLEGEDGFGIADRIEVHYIDGNNFNDDGDLIDGNGVVSFDDNIWRTIDSYDNFNWTTKSWGTNGWNPLPFNPLTVENALDVYSAFLLKDADFRGANFVEGIGQVEIDLDEELLDSITAGSTTMFDGINISADSNDSLEDEDTFLDINAALTLEAILGDYQVKLQLSGERTAIENGTFNLNMSYRLPGADTQRSFTAHYNTEMEGRLTANNTDGVVLVMNDADEEATGTQVLGQILVGPTAIVAATIQKRENGLIVVVYSDIDGDGIHDEESL